MEQIQLTSLSSSLKLYASDLKESISQLSDNAFNKIETYELDCNSLPTIENGWKSGVEATQFISLIEPQYENPAIYWFEITSLHSARDIYDYVIELKEQKLRNLPAHKKLFSSWDSNILYVGKVKSNLAGRMLLHLGYGNAPSVQGLQLCHWLKHKDLKLKLNVIYLPKNLDVLAGVFELQLARQLKPILGKHR